MNIGSTSMDAPAMFAAGALKGALNVQADMVGKLLNPQNGQQSELQTATAAAYGIGQNLDLFV